MRLQTQILGHVCELSLERRDGGVLATIDGRSYDLRIHNVAAGEYLVVEGTEVHDCLVVGDAERRVYEVNMRGGSYEVAITDPKRLRSSQAPGSQNHGVARIVAPMPGKVVRVLVEVGAQVEAGEGIIVVEAMKMQNEMKAPKAGSVVSLSAKVGTTVNAGEVLAVIE